MQQRRRGYALISYRDSDRKYEADTLTCCHCQRVIFLHAADTIAKDAPGYCPTCHAATCNACALKGGCQPFEAKVDASEKRGAERQRLFREMGIVGLLVSLFACGYAQPEIHALCGTDAPSPAIDAAIVDAPPGLPPFECPPSTPPATFVDPTGQGHPDVTIGKPVAYACSDAARPLIVFLHGYGNDSGNSTMIRFGFRYAAKYGAALTLTPNGLLQPGTSAVRYWNADPSSSDKLGVGNDDTTYLRQLVTWALTYYNVDRTRVVVIGTSNGGFMAERLRCQVSDLVTHMVDASGAGQSSGVTCAGAVPVHAIVDHSVTDTGVQYNGGRLSGMSVDYVSTATTLAQNAAQSGCSGDLALVEAFDHDTDVAGADTDRLAYPTCTGAVVEHWKRPTGAHSISHWTMVPGCSDTACQVALQTKFAEHAMAFVQEHPR